MNPYYEKARSMQLPPLPWSIENLGDEVYCHLASELGYFNPRSERADYRPSLDPSPFIDLIGQNLPSQVGKIKNKEK